MIISTIIVREILEEWDYQCNPSPPTYILSLDKFILKAFNRLFHDCEIGRPLVANFLLAFLDHYTPHTSVKTINIYIL